MPKYRKVYSTKKLSFKIDEPEIHQMRASNILIPLEFPPQTTCEKSCHRDDSAIHIGHYRYYDLVMISRLNKISEFGPFDDNSVFAQLNRTFPEGLYCLTAFAVKTKLTRDYGLTKFFNDMTAQLIEERATGVVMFAPAYLETTFVKLGFRGMPAAGIQNEEQMRLFVKSIDRMS